MGLHRQITPILLLVVAACTTIAPYNQRAYEQATSVKAEALLVMDAATEPFNTHREEIRNLRLAIEKAYEYAKGRPKNELSTRQWEIIRDSNRNSLAGFLKRWEDKGVLKDAFVFDQKDEIAKHFDHVIGLEVGKVMPRQEEPAHADAR